MAIPQKDDNTVPAKRVTGETVDRNPTPKDLFFTPFKRDYKPTPIGRYFNSGVNPDFRPNKIPTPTTYDPRSRLLSNEIAAETIRTLGSKPEVAGLLSKNPAQMTTVPEIAGAVGDPQTAAAIVEAAFTDTWDRIEFKATEDTSELVLNGLQAISEYGSEEVNSVLMLLLPTVGGEAEASSLAPSDREKLISESFFWLKDHPNIADSPEEQAEYAWWATNVARGLQQREFGRNSIVGALGEFVETPFRAVSLVTRELQNSAALNSSALTPQDAYYRRILSPGQNVALSWGADVGGGWYNNASGAIDGVYNVTGDPIGWAGAFSQGRRLARTAAMIDNIPKYRLWARALTPVYGARPGKLIEGRKVRFIWQRIGYLSNSKSVDGLLSTKKMEAAYEAFTKTNNPALILEMMPELEAAPRLVEYISESTDASQIKRAFKDTFTGAFTDVSPVYKQLEGTADAAQDTFNSVLREEVSTIKVEARRVVARPSGEQAVDELGNMTPIKVNEGVRDDALSMAADISAAKKPVLEEAVTTHTGLRLTLKYYDVGGTKAVIATDEAGKIVGTRIGSSSGVGIQQANGKVKNLDGKGIYTAILEGQKKHQGVTIDDFIEGDTFIESGAVGAINRVFAEEAKETISLRAAAGASGYSETHGIWVLDAETGRLVPSEWAEDGARKLIFDDNAKVVNLGSPAEASKFQTWVDELDVPTIPITGPAKFTPEEVSALQAVAEGVNKTGKRIEGSDELIPSIRAAQNSMDNGLGAPIRQIASGDETFTLHRHLNVEKNYVEYFATDADDVVVAAVSAEPGKVLNATGGGISMESKRSGLMDQIWDIAAEQGDEFVLQSGASPSISDKALKFESGYAAKRLGDARALDDFDDVALAYGKAQGADAIVYGDEGGVLIGNQKYLEGYDNSNEVTSSFLVAFAENQQGKQAFNSYKNAGSTRGWVIKDMPTGKFAYDIDKTKKLKPPRWSGGSNNRSWWVRAGKARVFSEAPEAQVSLFNTTDGVQQLKKLFFYFGVDYDTTIRLAGKYADSAYEDRLATVIEVITEAGDAIKHPFLRDNLMEFFQRQAVRGFGLDENGVEILRTPSRSTIGQMSARPFMPTQLAAHLDVPDPVQLVRSLKRYKMANSRVPTWNGGFFKGTQDARIGVGHKIKAQLGDKAKDVSPEELAALAYASVDKGLGSGVGAVARLGEDVHTGWRFLVSSFSVAQLALRPIAWWSRVYLDENARGAFAGLPTIMGNPARYLSSVWDARAATKANKRKAFMLSQATGVMDQFNGLNRTSQILSRAEETVPNLPRLLAKEFNIAEDAVDKIAPSRLKAMIADLVEQAVLKNDFSEVNVGVSVYRRRGWQHSIDVVDDLGIDITQRGTTFNWADDVPEIANAGWAQAAGLNLQSVPITWVAGQMTDRSVRQSAMAVQHNLQQLAKDPFGRAAMTMMSRRAIGQSVTGIASEITASSGWQKLRPYISQWASAKGYDGLSETALAEKYLDEVVSVYARNLLSPLMPDDLGDQSRILQDIVNGDLVDMHGMKFNFRDNSDGLAEMESLLRQLNLTESKIPPQWMSLNPHSLMDEPSAGILDKVKHAPGNVIRFMGDEMSQKLQRRGSYLEVVRRQTAYRESFGMSNKAATQMARMKAADIINNVYYNMESVTPFLRSMNQVSPFFTATWEIAQTWAYKVPMMQGGMGIGHARVIRKIDRFTTALNELGLIEYDENGAPRLTLDADANTGNWVGDEMSKRGAIVLRQPLLATEHLINLGHSLASSEAVALDSSVPTKFSIAASSPIDVEHYGVGSALDLSLGMQPLAQWGLSDIRRRIPAIADVTNNVGEGTIAETADLYDVDPRRLIAYNSDLLRAHLGVSEYNNLRFGDLDITEVDVTGLDLKMPNTSMLATWVGDSFFPFGDIDNIGDMLSSFSPQWAKYAMRSAGLWQQGDAESGFLGIDQSSVNAAALNGQVLSGFRHLEATEGLMTRRRELMMDFGELAEPYFDTGALVWSEDGSQLDWKGEKPASADEVEQAFHNMMDYNKYAMDRAINLGASTSMFRAILSAILPGTPQLLFEEEKHLDAYYEAYEFNKFVRGETENIPVLRRTGISNVIEYLNEWMVDPSGKSTALKFLENHPDLAPYLVGKTYWEEAGQPPLETSIELYFQDIEDGLRKPVPPDVFLTRNDIQAVETERDVAFIEKYGSDPYHAVAAALADPEGYQDLQETHNIKRWIIDEEDEMNGSPYKEWKDRNAGEDFDITAEQLKQYGEVVSTLNDAIELVEASPTMSPGQIKDAAGYLQGLKQGVNGMKDFLDNAETDTSWMTPHRALYIRYFEEIYVPYLEEIGAVYDEIAEATTSEQADIGWNKIANITDSWTDSRSSFDERPEVVLPSPPQYQWDNKSPLYKDHSIAQGIVGKIEWLDRAKAERIVEAKPQLMEYLPSTPAQRLLIDQVSTVQDELDKRYDNGNGEMEHRQYVKAKKAIQKTFKRKLLENGWTGMFEWNQLWPVQKLDLAEELPYTFQKYDLVSLVSMIQAEVVGRGNKSVGEDDPGRNGLSRQIYQWLESDDQFYSDLTDLGFRLYDTRMIDKIIPIVFFNENPQFAG